MWLMLQNEIPSDYVLATGEQHSVREFVEEAFKVINIHLEWIGDGLNEKGINRLNNEILVEIDPRYYRPTEVDSLLGDPTKAIEELNWNPKLTSFIKLVDIIVRNDLKNIK